MTWWAHVYPIFEPREFACHCGQCAGSTPEGVADLMDKSFVLRLHALRLRIGVPATITSGYRCPDHNARVSNTGRDGPHTTGHAADIAWNRATAFRTMKHLEDLGFTGVGWQQKGGARFIHLDDLELYRPTVFSY